MSKNYMYMLGAGASAYSLPLVSNFGERLSQFRKTINSTTFGVSRSGQNVDTHSIKQQLVESIDWLLQNLKLHASIDTFAKKLYFKHDRKNLSVLKAVLSCFFVGEQSVRPVDYCYDNFFASVLQSDGFRAVSLPDDIRFLTWNYDLQLEKLTTDI